ncbi:MAG: helix-turn-helix domain-containing protein [Rhizobiales bacterium]|nr:helix-turn-helix domain-containing protein [Hyphomicrobiales bacterium]
MPSYEPVTALLRGLTVLEAVAAAGAASIKDLHARTGIPKATLVRILETLIHAGYVYCSGAQPLYALTARPLNLAAGFDKGRHLVAVVGPILVEFQAAIPWPSDLGMFDRDAMVILETSRRPGVLSVSRRVGSRVTAVRTALGRAYLAFLPDRQRQAALIELKALAEEPKNIARFDADLAVTRARGYALSDQENQPDIRAIAAPVFDGSGVVASVNVIVVAEAMSIAELQERYSRQLLAITARMSAALRGAA